MLEQLEGCGPKLYISDVKKSIKLQFLFCRKLRFQGIRHLYFRGMILLNKL